MNFESITYSFVEKLWSAPISESAIEKAKYGLLDYIASAYAGKDDPGVDKLIRMTRLEGGHALAPVLFRGLRATPTQAALINGFMGHALDYDDVHLEVRGHPSTVLIPTLFALSNEAVTGRRFLKAYIIGVEAMARIAQGLSNEHYERGFHNTSTAGVLAATLAGAYLRSYPIEQACRALGFATTQAGGLRVHFGTETKPLHAGIAASSAVRALLLTEVEFQANSMSLDGDLGFFQVYGQGTEQARELLLKDFGTTWRIETPGLWYKLYPFCSAAYYGVHAAEQIGPVPLDDIDHIEFIFTHRSDAALINRKPKDGEEGRFSIEYIAALILSGQGLALEAFQRRPISEEIHAYIRKMRRSNRFDVPGQIKYTQIDLTLKNGTVIRTIGDRPKGSPEHPVTEQELIQKYRDIVRKQEADRLLERIFNLDHSNQFRAFMEQLLIG